MFDLQLGQNLYTKCKKLVTGTKIEPLDSYSTELMLFQKLVKMLRYTDETRAAILKINGRLFWYYTKQWEFDRIIPGDPW